MRLAILCPGQGGQQAAMLDALRAPGPARDVLDACAAAGFDPFAALAPGAEPFRNAIAQPLLCAHQLACWSALRSSLPAPALIAGYSVGELAAYGCAGALDAGALVALARARAAAMDASAAGQGSGLLALRGADRARVDRWCRGPGDALAIAIDIAGDHVIVGGRRDALDRLEREAAAAGVDARRLPVDIAAHTPLLAAAVPVFRAALERSAIVAPAVPVLAGIDGGPVRDRPTAIDRLARQLAAPVRWSACLDAAHERGCRVFLELGARDALARMVRDRFDDVQARSVSDFGRLEAAADWACRALAA